MIPRNWRRLLAMFRDARLKLLAVLPPSLAQTFLLLPVPLVVKDLFDTTLPGGDQTRLVLTGAALLGLYGLSEAAGIGAYDLILRQTNRVLMSLRTQLVDKLYSLSLGFITARERESFHDRIVHDTQRIGLMMSALFVRTLPSVLLCIGISTALMLLNAKLFLLSLGFVPLLWAGNRLIGRSVWRETRRFHRGIERFNAGILRILRIMDLTRARAAEAQELRRQNEIHDELRHSGRTLSSWSFIYRSTQRLILAGSIVAVLILGGLAVLAGTITLGELFSFYAGFALLRWPVESIFYAVPDIMAGNQALTRVLSLLDEDDRRPYVGSREIEFQGNLFVDDVWFSYAQEPILRGVSLQLEPGHTVALLGPNGSGKTTLVRLMLGFYRPQRGRFWAETQPYDELDISKLRRRIGLVPQEPLIVDGSVAQNLAYGLSDVPLSSLRAAAELSTAAGFIEQLPRGYDTRIGEGGMQLSGGQRQRLAIARALVNSPPLLILDEPTHHLDRRSLRELLTNLGSLSPSPAVLLISHDPRAIMGADRVLHLDKGQLISAPEGPVSTAARAEGPSLER